MPDQNDSTSLFELNKQVLEAIRSAIYFAPFYSTSLEAQSAFIRLQSIADEFESRASFPRRYAVMRRTKDELYYVGNDADQETFNNLDDAQARCAILRSIYQATDYLVIDKFNDQSIVYEPGAVMKVDCK